MHWYYECSVHSLLPQGWQSTLKPFFFRLELREKDRQREKMLFPICKNPQWINHTGMWLWRKKRKPERIFTIVLVWYLVLSGHGIRMGASCKQGIRERANNQGCRFRGFVYNVFHYYLDERGVYNAKLKKKSKKICNTGGWTLVLTNRVSDFWSTFFVLCDKGVFMNHKIVLINMITIKFHKTNPLIG